MSTPATESLHSFRVKNGTCCPERRRVVDLPADIGAPCFAVLPESVRGYDGAFDSARRQARAYDESGHVVLVLRDVPDGRATHWLGLALDAAGIARD